MSHAPTLQTQLDAGDIPMRASAAIARQAELVLEADAAASAPAAPDDDDADDAAVEARTTAWVDAERLLGTLLQTAGFTIPPGREEGYILLRLVDGRLILLVVHEYSYYRTGTRHVEAEVRVLPEIVDLQRAAEASGRGRRKEAQAPLCHQREE